MKTRKYEKNYFLVSISALLIVNFVFFIITYSIARTADISPAWAILLLILLSLTLAFLISFGYTWFSQVLSDAMMIFRRRLYWNSLTNPLLLRLSEEAPGTYHHSIMVSNIAQKACKAIGADSLLVRTAAYYHDIGKLYEPLVYVENQADIDIPSDEDSATIRKNANSIISHVKKGIKIAKENNMPEDMIDLISEHHGITRALFFYEKAKDRGLKIKKTDFRYPGPIPQTKESVVLMLADCVEATARAYESLSKTDINNIVDSTIEEKIADNQFKNANLSETEIAKIRSALIESLNSIYHQRINYQNGENESNSNNK